MALLGALLFGAVLVPVLPLLSPPGRQAAGRAWARGVLRAVGVGLDVRGRPPERRALLVANHVSWLDIVSILAVTPARMLAKHEVRHWPLIGVLAALGGVIFVDRTRPRTLPSTVARVADALRADDVVAVFPEGTTWCGLPRTTADCGGGGRFRPAMFQAAIDADVPVVPVHLGYDVAPAGGGTSAPAFLAEENLLTSVCRVLALRGLVVTLTAVDEPWFAGPPDRRGLAAAAQAAVRAVGSPAGPTAPVDLPIGSGTLELAA